MNVTVETIAKKFNVEKPIANALMTIGVEQGKIEKIGKMKRDGEKGRSPYVYKVPTKLTLDFSGIDEVTPDQFITLEDEAKAKAEKEAKAKAKTPEVPAVPAVAPEKAPEVEATIATENPVTSV